MNPQFNNGVLELCVLAMSRSRDFYGYELVEQISKKIELSEGTIYPILRRLTQVGYFETYLKESTEGPPRKYYRITADGKKACAQMVADWTVFIRNVDGLLKAGVES